MLKWTDDGDGSTLIIARGFVKIEIFWDATAPKGEVGYKVVANTRVLNNRFKDLDVAKREGITLAKRYVLMAHNELGV